MSLRGRRRAVKAQHLRVQALRQRGEARVDTLVRRTRALWPWFWLGGGALLGLAAERELARPPRARGRATWFGALPWGSLLSVVERVLVAALLAHSSPTPLSGATRDRSTP